MKSTVEALKTLYAAHGGNVKDFEGIRTIPDGIEAIAANIPNVETAVDTLGDWYEDSAYGICEIKTYKDANGTPVLRSQHFIGYSNGDNGDIYTRNSTTMRLSSASQIDESGVKNLYTGNDAITVTGAYYEGDSMGEDSICGFSTSGAGFFDVFIFGKPDIPEN